MNIKQTLILSTSIIAGLVGATGIASADQITVKSGDTLSELALTHSTTVDSLQSINNIDNAHLIYVGELLETAAAAANVAPVKQAPVQQAPVQEAAPVVEAPAVQEPVAEPVVEAPVVQEPVAEPVEVSTPAVSQPKPKMQIVAPSTPEVRQEVRQAPVVKTNSAGSTYDQFIANGGTPALWHAVVMPESTGNANAVSPNGYRGLGQTKEAWGVGSVATQTQGMLGYANSRYGSIENAIAFRQANGWW